jgi:microcystin-dependent protein
LDFTITFYSSLKKTLNYFLFFINKENKMNNYSNNTRSMNGLNNINANSGTFEEIDVNTLVVNTSGTAPTIADPLDYSDNIATTEWVTNHAGVGYVTINTTQNITGEKTFSNANTIVSGNLITNSIRSSSGTTDINIGQNLTTGDINMGTTFIGPTMNVALNWGSGSNSGQLALRGGSFTLASTGNYNQSSGASFQTNISTNQSTGELAIGTAGNRSGAIYINTGNTSTAPIFISSGTNANAPITIGSTASTTQTCNMNAITNFSKIPSCAITATSANELVNLTTLNGAITTAGSGYVTLAGAQTITGDKTFTGSSDFLSLNASYISNTSSIDTPSVASGLQTDDLNIGQNQTSGKLFLGCRTDRTGAINIGTLATGNAPIVVGSTSSTTQTATHNAITTFNKIPFCSGVPATGNHLVNKTYTDGTFVDLTSNQSIAGIKTFTDSIEVWNNIDARSFADPLTIGDNLTTGDIFLAPNATSSSLNWGNPSCTGLLNLQGGEINIYGSQNFTARCGLTSQMNIADTQTSGVINIGGLTNRSGSILINTGPSSTATVAISSLTSLNAPIIIGSSTSTTQTATHNAISTFTKIPQCAINSIGDNNDLINYGTLNQRFTDERPYFNPTGTIITYAGSSAPTGYLLCDGTLYSQFTYPSLFSVIFNTYGGSFPNFRVPNTQGLFISSSGTQTLNSISYTRTLATRQNDTIANHKHTYSDSHYYDDATSGQPNGSTADGCLSGSQYQTPGGDTAGMNADEQFQNRLTKGTFLASATQVNQATAPTVGVITGTETYPANIAFGHYIKY